MSTILAIEFFALFAAIIIYFLVIYFTTKMAFHLNFLAIIVYATSMYVVDMICRMIIILYEIGVVRSEGPLFPENHLPPSQNDFDIVVFICSLVRVHFMVIISILSFMIAAERYFATILVSTYENRRHYWVMVFVLGNGIIGPTIGTILVHFDIFISYILIALAIILNIVCYMFFIVLYTVNHRNLTEPTKRYTLSFRFQLNENLKLIKWMKSIFTIVNIVNCTAAFIFAGLSIVVKFGALYAIAAGVLRTEEKNTESYGYLICVTGLLSDKYIRRAFLKHEPIRVLTMPFFGRFFPDDFAKSKTRSATDEANVYFTTLTNQWDIGLEPKKIEKPRKWAARKCRVDAKN
ncbi:unnamed protein product [Caenorhabditis bovis]|uniref:Uncharacterized protein n=1 Tax=Caenorhabditis bovis TaxID=2654633 RepID=A0A8S1EZ37_9PELO|nr:unnamed protein product [Caenorhabditis bovis]